MGVKEMPLACTCSKADNKVDSDFESNVLNKENKSIVMLSGLLFCTLKKMFTVDTYS